MSGDMEKKGQGAAQSEGAAPGLTAADLDRLAALHEAAAGKAYTFRKQLSEDGRRDLWAIDGAAFASDAEVMCAARNALPSLLALARRGLEAEQTVAHAIGCDVDARRDRDEWRQIAEKAEACAVGLNNARMDLESKLAAALAEVERLRGRLSRASLFLTGDGVKITASIDDGYLVDATWFPSLDAAWSAAEAQAAQAQGGEGAVMAKSKPDLKCAWCGLIGSCYFNEPNQGWYCVEGCEAAKKRGTPEQAIVCEDAPGPCAACHNDTDGEVIDSADYCDSCAILIYREKLAAMQSRAEKAEHALEITGDARALARFRETERERDALKVANAALSDGVLAYEAKVAALEARLAELGPVVEAAERQEAAERVGAYLSDNEADRLEAGMAFDRATHETNNAVRAMRAARSLRGAGENNQENPTHV